MDQPWLAPDSKPVPSLEKIAGKVQQDVRPDSGTHDVGRIGLVM
jgi:hypothetical protein